MRFGRAHQRERRLNVDLTPMIDVVFQLLVFFLTTTRMAELTRADIELPHERGQEERSREETGLIVNILKDGGLVVAGRDVDLEELEAMALEAIGRAQSEGIPMPKPMVRADRGAPAGRLNAVLETLRHAGFAAVRIATSPGGGG